MLRSTVAAVPHKDRNVEHNGMHHHLYPLHREGRGQPAISACMCWCGKQLHMSNYTTITTSITNSNHFHLYKTIITVIILPYLICFKISSEQDKSSLTSFAPSTIAASITISPP